MFIVEGNIGIGKSTFCQEIRKLAPEIDIALEPVTNWARADYGSSLLANFYADTPRWAYTLETLSMICRARDHIREQEEHNSSRLIERSIYSGYFCFAKNCYQQGNLSELEWAIYNQWADFLLKQSCKPPHGFIYLQGTPEVCFERIAKRGRESEQDITLEYVRQIHDAHENFLVARDVPLSDVKDVPVLVLDCNEEFASDRAKMSDFMQKVKNFMAKCTPAIKQMPTTPKALTT